jgi:DNA-binding transcriptional regulator YiaG
MQLPTPEARVILAIKAIRKSRKLSIRGAAKLYNVPFSTLRDRITGTTSIAEYRPAAQILTDIEEDVII